MFSWLIFSCQSQQGLSPLRIFICRSLEESSLNFVKMKLKLEGEMFKGAKIQRMSRERESGGTWEPVAPPQ